MTENRCTITHTPGPWEMLPEETDKEYIRVRGTRLGRRYKIANILKLNYEGAELENEQTKANARLITAAPELLEALEKILNSDYFIGGVLESEAVQAIAKARGELRHG